MSLLIPGTNSIKDTSYDVDNSLRFNSGSSDYLNRTPSSASNRDLWSISVWVKRSKLGIYSTIYGVYTSSSNQENFGFLNNDKFQWQLYQSGGVVGQLTTNRVFRDTNSWYHILGVYNSADGTAGNRMRLYINGVEETSFATDTNPSSGQDSLWNNNTLHMIGGGGGASGGDFFDGYMSELVAVDGTALSPTDVGEFDSASPNIWKPKDVSGLTFGTNGFHLDFENASSLGADVSGNSNNFTVNNLTSVDQSTDTCTNNYATFNPLNPSSSNISFEQGNLTFKTDGSASGQKAAFANFGVSTGKWYAELKMTAVSTQSGSYPYAGVAGIDKFAHTYIGANLDSVAYNSNGAVYSNESEIDSGEAGYGAGNIVGIAADITNKKIYIHVNGTYINSQNPTSGANGYTLPTNAGGFYTFAVSLYGANGTWEANFGSPSFSISSGNTDDNNYGNFEYDVPAGFYALNTKNLAEFG